MGCAVIKKFFAMLLCLFAIKSYAQASEQFLVVPNCLLTQGLRYEELAQAEAVKLIKTRQLKQLQSASLKKPNRCRGFINVTHDWEHYVREPHGQAARFLRRYVSDAALSDLTRGYKIQYQRQIQALLPQIKTQYLKHYLETLTAFKDRDVESVSGLEAANWIEQYIKKMTAINRRHDVSIYRVATAGGKQPSIVLKLGASLSAPAIVIGAPMDTLAASFNNRKPGADDSASSVATLLETARVLLGSPFQYKKPIYLVWYAGEEAGKLGSQSVVRHFNQTNIAVDSVLQLDKTGYPNKKQPGIGLVDDFTDMGLTAYVADLVAVYVKQAAGIVGCGYACSDHVSWYLNGNRVAYPFETMEDKGNPYVQTRYDTIDKLSIEHMVDFVKLSIAFAVELSEPLSSDNASG